VCVSCRVPQDLQLGLSAAEDAARLATQLVRCVADGKETSWLKSIVPLKATPDDVCHKEMADAVAHLIIEGQHLRSLRRRASGVSVMSASGT
jgi:hypothetical protein